MNPMPNPDSAQNRWLVLTIAAVVVAGWLTLKARRSRRRAAEAAADPAAAVQTARDTSGWFGLLLIGAGLAFGWTQSGARRGSPGVAALVGLVAVVPLLWVAWVVGSIVWQFVTLRVTYRAATRAHRRAARGDIDGAIAELRAAVERRRRPAPGSGDAWAPPPSADGRDPRRAADLAALGDLERLRGDWAAAVDHFAAAEAAAEGPLAAQVRAARGDALIRLGRADEGIELMRSAVEQVPPDGHANRAQLGLSLATALTALGRLDEVAAILDAAEADWRRAVILAPPRHKKAGFAQIAAARDQLAAARAGYASGGDAPASEAHRSAALRPIPKLGPASGRPPGQSPAPPDTESC